MAAQDHPFWTVAVTAAGTATFVAGLFTQIVQPTISASLENKIEALSTENTALKQSLAEKGGALETAEQALQEDRQRTDRERADLHDRIEALGQQLFVSQQANMLTKGNPYPVGLDAIRLGNAKDKVMSLYPSGKLSGSGHQMVVNIPDAQLFREIRYEHYDEKAPSWTIDSIVFSYRKIDRILDKSLP